LATSVTIWWVTLVGGVRGEVELLFDQGQLTEAALAAATVVGVLDRGHNRVADSAGNPC
jgi:hypothetical protein